MRLGIIGGGPGGLMTAYLLEQQSVPVEITLFEAAPLLGGKVVTGLFANAPVAYEAGAAELYDYSLIGLDPLRELVRELGLSVRPLDGRTVILGDRLLQTDDDIRRHLGQNAFHALEVFRQRARSLVSTSEYYEPDWEGNNRDPLANQSFHELLATIPNESVRNYIRVAVHSDLATEPHQTTALYGLHNFLMNEPSYMRLYTIDGGIDSLVKKLAARISARILLSHRVTSVEKTREGTYRVRSRCRGAMSSGEFDLVVVALPNNWIPAIEWRGDRLCKAMHAHHLHYDYPAHYLRVSMLFKQSFWRETMNESYFMLDAFGGCCAYDESPRHDDVPFGALGFLMGGQAALNLSNLDDNALIEEVLEALPRCLRDARRMFLEGRVHRWVGSVNGVPSGKLQREPDSRHVPDPEQNSRLLVVGDYLFDSTLNGVLDSAATVVEFIQEEVAEFAGVQSLAAKAASL